MYGTVRWRLREQRVVPYGQARAGVHMSAGILGGRVRQNRRMFQGRVSVQRGLPERETVPNQ